MSIIKPYDFLIVGAGLFGSVFARQATDAGRKCLVIDKRSHIGGNAYTEDVEGIQVHKYGAHIFHTNDKKIWDYVNRFASFNDYRHTVKVNYKHQLLSFPINLATFEELYGIHSKEEAQHHLKSVQVNSIANDFESWALQQVGAELFEIFIKGYTEKQWGRPASELPSSIIKRIPIRTDRNDNYFDDIFQGIPIGGYTKMVANMLEGIEVKLDTDYLKDKTSLDAMAGKVIYTGPIDAYHNYCFGDLEYRGLRFKTEVKLMEFFQSKAVVNYTEAQVPFTRIIEHKHFESVNSKKTVVTKEYPREWKRGQEPFYPINDAANKALFLKYKELSRLEDHVIFGGRLAEYKYYDMHQVIASAISKYKLFVKKYDGIF